MGVTEGGIHWLDGLIFFGLCFGVWVIWRITHAIMAYREVEAMLKKDMIGEPYDWEEDGL